MKVEIAAAAEKPTREERDAERMANIAPNTQLAKTDKIYSDWDGEKADHGDMQESAVEHMKDLMNNEKQRVADAKTTKLLNGEAWTANMPSHLLEGYVQENVEETADVEAEEGEDAEDQEDNEEADQQDEQEDEAEASDSDEDDDDSSDEE